MMDPQIATFPQVEPPEIINLVEIAYARTPREAAGYCDALRNASITAGIEKRHMPPRCGIAVLVDSSQLVPASSLLTTFAHENEDPDDDSFDDEDDGDNDEDLTDEEDDDDAEFDDGLDDDDDEDDDDYEDDDDD